MPLSNDAPPTEDDKITAEPLSEFQQLVAEGRARKKKQAADPEDEHSFFSGLFGKAKNLLTADPVEHIREALPQGAVDFIDRVTGAVDEKVDDLVTPITEGPVGDAVRGELEKLDAQSLAETAKELGTQVGGGLVDAAKEMTQTLDSLGEQVFGEQGDEFYRDEHGRRIEGKAPEGVEQQHAVEIDEVFPEVEQSDLLTGQAVRGITQFTAPFAVGGAGLKAAGVAGKTAVGKVAQSTLLGAAVDATAFSPHDQRVADLIDQSFPAYEGPVKPLIDYLKSDPNDTEAQGRLKNALEGAVLGIGLDAVIEAASKIRPMLRPNKLHTDNQAVPYEAVKPEEQAAVEEALTNGTGFEIKVDYPDGSRTIPIDYGTRQGEVEQRLSELDADEVSIETPAGERPVDLIDHTQDIQAVARSLPEEATEVKIVTDTPAGEVEIDVQAPGAAETAIPAVARQIEASPDARLVAEGPGGPIEVVTNSESLSRDVLDLPEGATNARVISQGIEGPTVLPVSPVVDAAEAVAEAARQLPVDPSNIRLRAITPTGPVELPLPVKGEAAASLDRAASSIPREASDVRIVAELPSGPVDIPVNVGVDPAQALREVTERLPKEATDVRMVAQTIQGPITTPIVREVPRDIRDIAQKLPEDATGIKARTPSAPPDDDIIRARSADEAQPAAPKETEHTLEELGGEDALRYTVGKTAPDGTFDAVGEIKTPGVLRAFKEDAPSGVVKATRAQAHNRNMKYINTTEDIHNLIAEATTEAADLINHRRREVIPEAQTRQLAQSLGMTTKDLLSRRQGQAFNAEELVAAQQIVTDLATEVDRLKRVAERTRAPVDEVEFIKSLKVFNAVQAQYRGGVAEAGRALRALRYATGPGADQVARASELIAERGGIDRIYKAYDANIPNYKIERDPTHGGPRHLCD